MNKITAVIIEDEIPAARRLNNTLNELRPEWQITVLPGSVKKECRMVCGKSPSGSCFSRHTIDRRHFIHIHRTGTTRKYYHFHHCV